MLIERAGAAVLGTATAAAAALPHPTIWVCLGYPFEAASLIAAIFAAMTTRVIIGLRTPSATWALDISVMVLVLVTTAAIVIGWRTNLVGGLLWGTGSAALGEGIIRLAQLYVNKGLAMAGIDAGDDHDAAMSDAMGKLKKLPPTVLGETKPGA